MSMIVAFIQQAAEPAHVGPQITVGIQEKSVSIDLDQIARKSFPERIQRLAEKGFSTLLVLLRPEEVDERIPPAASMSNGKIDKQGQRFSSGKLDWIAIVFNVRWTEYIEL